FERAADFIGLPPEVVVSANGRIGMRRFARGLLRDERRFVGLYDASIAGHDPFPDRDSFDGPAPTAAGIGRMLTGAINTHLRQNLGIDEDEREYHLLNYDVFENWRYDSGGNMRQGFVSAVDELRFGMAINPDMQVFITHGLF